MFGDYSSVTGSIRNDKILDLIIIGSGDGTAESGKEVLGGFMMAVVGLNPDKSFEQISLMLLDLGLTGSEELPEESEIIVDDVKYSYSYSDMIGSMLVITKE